MSSSEEIHRAGQAKIQMPIRNYGGAALASNEALTKRIATLEREKGEMEQQLAALTKRAEELSHQKDELSALYDDAVALHEMQAEEVCRHLLHVDALELTRAELERRAEEAEGKHLNELAFNEGYQEHISDLLGAMGPFVSLLNESTGHIATAKLSFAHWHTLSKAYRAGIAALHEELSNRKTLLARVAELEGLLQRWLSLHEEPCRLDHHANCQSHFLEPYCIVARTRNALAAKTEPLTGETNAV